MGKEAGGAGPEPCCSAKGGFCVGEGWRGGPLIGG